MSLPLKGKLKCNYIYYFVYLHYVKSFHTVYLTTFTLVLIITPLCNIMKGYSLLGEFHGQIRISQISIFLVDYDTNFYDQNQWQFTSKYSTYLSAGIKYKFKANITVRWSSWFDNSTYWEYQTPISYF